MASDPSIRLSPMCRTRAYRPGQGPPPCPAITLTLGQSAELRPRRGVDGISPRIRRLSYGPKRHRRVLSELASTIGADATFEGQDARIPYLDVHGRDDSLIKETERFLALERKERVELHTWPERCEPSAALSMLSWSTFSGPTRRTSGSLVLSRTPFAARL